MSTYSAKAKDIVKIGADRRRRLVVGRLATIIANRLRGKAQATLHAFDGLFDNIIVIIATKIAFSGAKRKDKTYYWHTLPRRHQGAQGAPILDGKFPERVLNAVKRMLPAPTSSASK